MMKTKSEDYDISQRQSHQPKQPALLTESTRLRLESNEDVFYDQKYAAKRDARVLTNGTPVSPNTY